MAAGSAAAAPAAAGLGVLGFRGAERTGCSGTFFWDGTGDVMGHFFGMVRDILWDSGMLEGFFIRC